MIELEKELKFMAKEYGLSEKQVLNWWRSAVRQAWINSPFKRILEEEAIYLKINDNPKNMDRFPTVKRIDCVKCEKAFSPSVMDLDHVSGENKMSSLADAESFMKSILFTPRSNLQWLCGDLKRKRNKKDVTVSIGCHSVKSQMEKNPSLTEDEAWAERELNRIVKYDSVIGKLKEFDVLDIPKLKKDQEEILYKLLIENRSKDDDK